MRMTPVHKMTLQIAAHRPPQRPPRGASGRVSCGAYAARMTSRPFFLFEHVACARPFLHPMLPCGMVHCVPPAHNIPKHHTVFYPYARSRSGAHNAACFVHSLPTSLLKILSISAFN